MRRISDIKDVQVTPIGEVSIGSRDDHTLDPTPAFVPERRLTHGGGVSRVRDVEDDQAGAKAYVSIRALHGHSKSRAADLTGPFERDDGERRGSGKRVAGTSANCQGQCNEQKHHHRECSSDFGVAEFLHFDLPA